MKISKILGSLVLFAGSLLAIDPVSNLSSTTHTTSEVSSTAAMTFSWTPPTTQPTKYFYVLDTVSTTLPVSSVSKVELDNSVAKSSVVVTAPASGDYFFHIQSVDDGGSTSTVVHSQTAYTLDLDKGTVSAFSPDGGSYSDAQSVSLTKSEEGTIYYTLDGSTPTISSSSYSSAISIAVTATLKAILVDSAGNVGDVVSKTYTITNNPIIKFSNSAAVEGTTVATDNSNDAVVVDKIDVTGNGFTRYQYKFDAGSWNTVSDISTQVDISGKSTGTYTLYIKGVRKRWT